MADPRMDNAILESIADGVFTVDLGWTVRSFNRAAEEITGISRADAIGRRCCEVFRANICESACALRETLKTKKPIIDRRVYIVRADGQRVPISVSTALLKNDRGTIVGGAETFRDLSVEEELRRELTRTHSFEDMISKSPAMRRIFDLLPDIAESESTVVIQGDSGTGKELLARAIHNLSPRRDRPLVVVNCGAMPDALLESELFGHTAGAFTDAKRDRRGRFSLADGGTLFLDEIGDVSAALQARLLRVVQDGTYEPLGSSRTERADVRVIAATNKDLEALVEAGTFRRDLFYRLNVINLRLPALRERREDIPLLVEHFITRFSRLKGREITGISQDGLAALMRHEFTGNIRELENAIEHAFVMCRKGIIQTRHLPPSLQPSAQRAGAPTSFEDLEERFLLEALEQHGWNRAATARDLGIHKTTLWRKMKRLGITAPRRPRG